MRKLTLVFLLLALPLAAGSTRTTRSTTTISDGSRSSFSMVHDSNGQHYATWEHDGARYITHDPRVLEELADALAEQRIIGHEHSAIGRRHAEIGRQHAAIGREHGRIGRERGNLARRSLSDEEREARSRELDEETRRLEARQRELEEKQRDLEDEQRRLEEKQRASEAKAEPVIDRIFQRAVQAGTATRR